MKFWASMAWMKSTIANCGVFACPRARGRGGLGHRWERCRRRRRSAASIQVFTLHAELEGMRLLHAFDALLRQWRESGASIGRMARIHELAARRPLPVRAVIRGEVAGRSGQLAVQAPAAAALAGNMAAAGASPVNRAALR